MSTLIWDRIFGQQVDACRITIVIPTYNEADNLPAISEALLALELPHLQILVVDDNSPDGTGQVADALAARYNNELASQQRPRFAVIHRQGKGGLGTAYVAGMTRAIAEGADFVVQMDADFSHSPALHPADAGGHAGHGRRRGHRQPLCAGRLAGRALGAGAGVC